MKTTFWKRLFYLGVTEHMDFRLERRIILSNQFAVLIVVLTIFFATLASFRPNFNILPSLLMIFTASVIWILNYSGVIKVSRLLTCLTPAIGLLFINLYQKLGNTPAEVDILLYATPRMIILASAILPFTMFTAAERYYVLAGVLTILLLSFSYDLIHKMAGVDYEAMGIENSHYNIIYEDMVVLTILILFASGFMFRLSNQYDKRNEIIISDALQQTEQLRQNEGIMKKTLEELEESRKKDEERSWVSKGLAEMVAILQSGDDMGKLFDKLLTTLIRYTELNQGAFFIAEENQTGSTVLRLISCYAYNRKKYIEISVDSGEGLLGQTFLDGERCYLKEVPRDHFRITSGLGEATPRYLLIVPMKINNKVEGLMEFASFKPMEDRHFELLEKLGENMASYVSNNRVNARTKTLLEQAQSMSAEMKENEEELRQNLEELQATQEAVARKEKEYQARISELEDELAHLKKLKLKESAV